MSIYAYVRLRMCASECTYEKVKMDGEGINTVDFRQTPSCYIDDRAEKV